MLIWPLWGEAAGSTAGVGENGGGGGGDPVSSTAASLGERAWTDTCLRIWDGPGRAERISLERWLHFLCHVYSKILEIFLVW